MRINSIVARQIFDSRGFPTVECDVTLDDGSMGRAATPSGASTGSGEALELRDGGAAYNGKGVSTAIGHIHDEILPALRGKSADDQQTIDQLMIDLDGTENKSRLGANAILAVSLATAKAVAAARKQPLYAYFGEIAGNTDFTIPMPMFNILNGGKHAQGSTDIQEFMIVPVGALDITKALQVASETYHALGKILHEKGYATTVGDEGGYAPSLRGGTDEALELIESAIAGAGYQAGTDIVLALDVAASELTENNAYHFAHEGKVFTTEELIKRYGELIAHHPIVSIEDGLSEEDWSGWDQLTQELGSKMQLVADDLLVTNPRLLQKAIDEKAGNAILIKPNQIGTLTETIKAVKMAQAAGWHTVISHRSGETEDTTIAHLAVGLNAGQIKTGSFSRSERIAKYNELVRIAEKISPKIQNPFM